MSDLWWFDSIFLSLACFCSQLKYWMANKIIECIINSDCIGVPFLLCWTSLIHKKFESSHQTFAVGGPGWFGIRLFTALIRNTCRFLIISAIHKFMVTCIDNISIQAIADHFFSRLAHLGAIYAHFVYVLVNSGRLAAYSCGRVKQHIVPR